MAHSDDIPGKGEQAGKRADSPKDQFRELSQLPADQLLDRATTYARASDPERQKGVAILRALGVVAGQKGTPAQKTQARGLVVARLRDPLETVRRYAINALPRLGSGPAEEAALLQMLEHPASEREKEALIEALQKIGGAQTLGRLAELADVPQRRIVEQKVAANVARHDTASTINLQAVFADSFELRLRCRQGLEAILEQEVRSHPQLGDGRWRVQRGEGFVSLTGMGGLCLKTLFEIRTFETLGLSLGQLPAEPANSLPQRLAQVVASPATLALLRAFTSGAFRYRLDFDWRKRQGKELDEVIDQIYALEPALLNDSRQAPWTIHVRAVKDNLFVELSPHAASDQRFRYRQDDIPAASHPPLAVALARLAGSGPVVWDPFCGSGTELIEARRLAKRQRVIGTDLSPEALKATAGNWLAAGFTVNELSLLLTDFRRWNDTGLFPVGGVDAILTNPPMGRRVQVEDLRKLTNALFDTARLALRRGGVIALANPIEDWPTVKGFRRTFRSQVDLGGFSAWLERYERL